jgi:predicted HAD superfamily phosphohydrolase YqeG
MRWRILDKVRADAHNIRCIETDTDTILCVDVSKVPKGMTLRQWLKEIQETGIAVMVGEDGLTVEYDPDSAD